MASTSRHGLDLEAKTGSLGGLGLSLMGPGLSLRGPGLNLVYPASASRPRPDGATIRRVQFICASTLASLVAVDFIQAIK